VNVGSIQALLGSAQQLGTQAGNATGGNNAFGSVFNNILASGPALVAPVEENAEDTITDETIMEIFNATTVEEIAELLGLGNISAQSSKQFAGLLDTDVDQLIENIIPLLEKAGLSESELTAAMHVNDFWSLLDVIDKIAPQFFAELTTALEGKGAIPKDQAVELLALLKSVTLAAPKMDLVMKQEQQVFSLQGFLVATSERVETIINSNQNRNGMVQLMEAHQIIRMVPQVQTGQNPANDESLKDTPKETVQPVLNQLSATRSEAAPAEVEKSNNARNEALLREMQNIFKRSNFGQTGGTNRLLIKLYPEHLGQVRIELLQVNGIMTARILASSAQGKEMLNSQLHQLKAAFVQQNLQVDRIDVSQTLQDTSRNDRDNAFNQHFKKEQEGTEEQQEQNPEDDRTFQEYMIELEA